MASDEQPVSNHSPRKGRNVTSLLDEARSCSKYQMIRTNEAQDWQRIKDPAKKWLGKFTYLNQDKNPPSEILNSLTRRYPNRAGVVYRGMNFPNEQSYNRFKEIFDNSNGQLSFKGVTSWSSDPTTAGQFAVTQPTYQLNIAVLAAHDQRKKNRERLSGYRGVILKTTVAAGAGIDVDASGVGHESEIVLPPGTYQTEIYQEIKQYRHSLESKDTTVDEVILNTSAESLRNNTAEHSFFDYVIHHHGQELSPRAQRHLLKLFGPQNGVPLFKSSVDQHTNYFTKKPEVTFDYHIPNIRLFELAEKGIFTPEVTNKIRLLGKKIISQALPIIESVIVDATYFNPAQLGLVSRVSKDTRVVDTIRKAIAPAVAQLNQQVKLINKIEDPGEKRQAIEQYKEEMVGLLKKLGVR